MSIQSILSILPQRVEEGRGEDGRAGDLARFVSPRISPAQMSDSRAIHAKKALKKTQEELTQKKSAIQLAVRFKA
jgi:hypothetical protein